MFDFEYDTAIKDQKGTFFRVLVTVYDDNDFELWALDLDRLMNIGELPRKDQLAIHNIIDERLSEPPGVQETDFGNSQDRRAEIGEMNKSRGLQ